MGYAQIDFDNYKLVYEKTAQAMAVRKFSNELRKHYRKGGGKDFEFSSVLINDLARVIDRRKLLKKKRFYYLRSEGDMFWYSMHTYPTKYGVVVGRVNIAFEKNEENKTIRIVGLEDTYDFNPKKRGERPGLFELVTRLVRRTAYHSKGQVFRIFYRAT